MVVNIASKIIPQKPGSMFDVATTAGVVLICLLLTAVICVVCNVYWSRRPSDPALQPTNVPLTEVRKLKSGKNEQNSETTPKCPLIHQPLLLKALIAEDLYCSVPASTTFKCPRPQIQAQNNHKYSSM